MCRSILRLRDHDEIATDEEIRAAALQFVRKISGYRTPSARNEEAFNRALSVFVRGRVHPHFSDEDEATARLVEAGFDDALLHRGDRHPAAVAVRGDPGAGLIRVIEGTTG